MTQKSMAQILNETITSYTSETRADSNKGCDYLTEDGRMCAVGRCMHSPTVDMEGPVSDMWERNRPAHVESLLKPEYQGHPLGFWANLQCLHDFPSHWDAKGLTPEGKDLVKRIATRFSIEFSEVPALTEA